MKSLINNLKSESSNFFNAANVFLQNRPKHRTLIRKSTTIKRRWKNEHFLTIPSAKKENIFLEKGSITSGRILNNAITMQAVTSGNHLKIG